MYFYTVPLTGKDTKEDPFRPSMPDGCSYVVIGKAVNGEICAGTPTYNARWYQFFCKAVV